MGEEVIVLKDRQIEKKRFSDFADNEINRLDGDKLKIDQILNQEIEIIGHKTKKSKFSKNSSGKYLTLQFLNKAGERKILFTGSDVLISQIEKFGDEIPFFATIKKIDRYYTLS